MASYSIWVEAMIWYLQFSDITWNKTKKEEQIVNEKPTLK